MKPEGGFFDEATQWRGLIRGDKAAFQLIYKEYFRILYSYGIKVCHNQEQVEDAIHDLFLDLWRYRENLAFTTSIRFYLFRALRRKIVKNETRDLAASIFDVEAGEFNFPGVAPFEDMIVQAEFEDERIKKLKRNLNNLSPRQYEALVLRFYGEFSYDEIASLLDMNEQSARNLVQRALEQLRNLARILSSMMLFGSIYL